MLNKQSGNMYGFVTHTWNPIKGKCPHECIYCYMKRYPQGDLRLDEKCFKDNLGTNNIIFVGSSTDMFAEDVPWVWIKETIAHCNTSPNNTYLFQTKNPARFYQFRMDFHKNHILATTIETDKEIPNLSKAPFTRRLSPRHKTPKRMISIEPVLDFTDRFYLSISEMNPDMVSIGADSKGNNLPEPSSKMILHLMSMLGEEYNIKLFIKPNLKRLIGKESYIMLSEKYNPHCRTGIIYTSTPN